MDLKLGNGKKELRDIEGSKKKIKSIINSSPEKFDEHCKKNRIVPKVERNPKLYIYHPGVNDFIYKKLENIKKEIERDEILNLEQKNELLEFVEEKKLEFLTPKMALKEFSGDLFELVVKYKNNAFSFYKSLDLCNSVLSKIMANNSKYLFPSTANFYVFPKLKFKLNELEFDKLDDLNHDPVNIGEAGFVILKNDYEKINIGELVDVFDRCLSVLHKRSDILKMQEIILNYLSDYCHGFSKRLENLY